MPNQAHGPHSPLGALEALPIHLAPRNHFSAPHSSLGLWDLSQPWVPSDTGPVCCCSPGLTGMVRV